MLRQKLPWVSGTIPQRGCFLPAFGRLGGKAQQVVGAGVEGSGWVVGFKMARYKVRGSRRNPTSSWWLLGNAKRVAVVNSYVVE